MLSRCCIVATFLVCCSFCAGEPDKTSTKLIIYGGTSLERFNKTDRVWNRGREFYTGHGWLSLVNRGQVPTKVAVWVRGIPELDLFLASDAAAKNEACASSPRNFVDATNNSLVGYRFCVPAASFEKAQGQIAVGADNAEPELIPLTLERPEGFFESKMGATTMAVMLVGLGALVGLVTFYIQQKLIQSAQQNAAFWEKKIAVEDKLIDFFRNNYNRYRNATDLADQAKARALRRVLGKEGIYGILPISVMKKVNAICDDALWEGSRVELLDELLKRHFSDLMRRD